MNKKGAVTTMNYAQILKGLREDRDLTQTEITKILQTSQSYYAQYENDIDHCQ